MTCGIIADRARLRPAVWSDGSPSFGVIRRTIVCRVDTDRPPRSGDIELTVSQLPKKVKSPAFAEVMFADDESGHPSLCAEDSARQSLARKAPKLIEIACDQVIKSWVANPARDASGKLVRSVQNATVKFTIDRP